MTTSLCLPEHIAFGHETDAIDLAGLTEDDAPVLRELIARAGVAVFRGQRLDDTGFVRVLTLLGPMTFTPGETPLNTEAAAQFVDDRAAFNAEAKEWTERHAKA